MSEIKPEKRLVSKRQYVFLQGKMAAWYSVGGMLVVFGVICLLVTVEMGLYVVESIERHQGDRSLAQWTIITGTTSIALFLFARSSFLSARSSAKSVEKVLPLTNRNSLRLPAEVMAGIYNFYPTVHFVSILSIFAIVAFPIL